MAMYQPLQRKNDDGTRGRWDMTCTDGSGTYPIGYCGRDGSCGGHDTAEEAGACWRKHRLDHDLRFDGHESHAWRPCEVCGSLTQGRAFLVGSFAYEWPLCDVHRNREGVDRANADAKERGKTLSGRRPFEP